jgi:hypothetical protein
MIFQQTTANGENHPRGRRDGDHPRLAPPVQTGYRKSPFRKRPDGATSRMDP